jgi:hypothetical protein
MTPASAAGAMLVLLLPLLLLLLLLLLLVRMQACCTLLSRPSLHPALMAGRCTWTVTAMSSSTTPPARHQHMSIPWTNITGSSTNKRSWNSSSSADGAAGVVLSAEMHG